MDKAIEEVLFSLPKKEANSFELRITPPKGVDTEWLEEQFNKMETRYMDEFIRAKEGGTEYKKLHYQWWFRMDDVLFHQYVNPPKVVRDWITNNIGIPLNSKGNGFMSIKKAPIDLYEYKEKNYPLRTIGYLMKDGSTKSNIEEGVLNICNSIDRYYKERESIKKENKIWKQIMLEIKQENDRPIFSLEEILEYVVKWYMKEEKLVSDTLIKNTARTIHLHINERSQLNVYRYCQQLYSSMI